MAADIRIPNDESKKLIREIGIENCGQSITEEQALKNPDFFWKKKKSSL